MIIIAIKGKNGSGKSTVAAILAKKLDEKGISNKVLSFAEPLKKIANEIYNYGMNKNPDWDYRPFKEQHRHNLEHVANALHASFSFNPFVYQMYKRLDAYYAYETEVCIISDLRFVSEYNGLYDWLETDDLTVVEISNVLTNSNPPEYDLDLINSDKILTFDGSIETQAELLIEELL